MSLKKSDASQSGPLGFGKNLPVMPEAFTGPGNRRHLTDVPESSGLKSTLLFLMRHFFETTTYIARERTIEVVLALLFVACRDNLYVLRAGRRIPQ